MLFDPYAFDLVLAGRKPGPALPGAALLAVPPEARDLLWRGLVEAVQGVLLLWERTPSGVKREPPAFIIQHAGQPRFNPDDLRWQTLEGWHRLMGLELRLAAQVVEALILTGEVDRYSPLLAEQCARVGQLYREMKRRAGAGIALTILHGELRLLRYRESPLLAPLIYN